MNKIEVVKQILRGKEVILKEIGKGRAYSNIALSKYWGKRDLELNLPTNSSLSVSLPGLKTTTSIELIENRDKVFLNEELLKEESIFYKRVKEFLDLFRKDQFFLVKTINNFPTAGGFASSASGFAALVKAVNDLFSFNLSNKELSILARLGSGSACRSISDGFVYWQKGEREDGLDSFATNLDIEWKELKIGILNVSDKEKKLSSTKAMIHTAKTSPYFHSWVEQAEKDCFTVKEAIFNKDFKLLGETAETNALAMHASLLGGRPGNCYFLPKTIEYIHKIWQLREEGLPIYFTIDAGPNIKIVFLEENITELNSLFPDLNIVKLF